ncbi:hypothetical protein P7M41_26625, partial [Vibrio parahaemolyticus]|nr:hypothetical protein [Vibrio parahaemolyticus]
FQFIPKALDGLEVRAADQISSPTPNWRNAFLYGAGFVQAGTDKQEKICFGTALEEQYGLKYYCIIVRLHLL